MESGKQVGRDGDGVLVMTVVIVIMVDRWTSSLNPVHIDDEMFVPHTIHHRFTFFFLCEVVSFIPFFLLLHNQW